MIRNFEDFCQELNSCGFSIGGGNAKEIFALIDFDWQTQDALDTPVRWHCDAPEVDPWEWRMRVLEERDDIAYAKVFFKTSGFITKEWYPDKTHIVDFEMLDASAPNKAQREKRRNFYLRNGYQETALFLSYLGVDYEVFCMGDRSDTETFKAMMKTIQVDGFTPQYRNKAAK